MIENQNPVRFLDETSQRGVLRAPRPVDVVQLQTTATTVFTARSDADFQLEHLVAANMTASADYVTLYMVPDGGAAGATNQMLYQVAIAAKSFVTIFDRDRMGLLQPGATIQALCGVNDAVNIWGFGHDYQGRYAD
jgi:hypothetical protein